TNAFSLPSGWTTMVEAGTSGWKNFPDFRDGVIKKSKTRILGMLNIVSAGMGAAEGENDPRRMDAEASAKMAKENPEYVVGFKSAHYAGPGWASIDNAVKAGSLANEAQ